MAGGLLALSAGACRHKAADASAALIARTTGLMHLGRDELPEADTAFRTVIRLDPASAAGYAGLAQVELRQGRLPEAEAAARRALARDSTDPAVGLLLATILQASGQTEPAREILTRFLQRNPANARLLFALAALSPSQRLPLLERLAALLPGNLALHVQLAGAWLERGADGGGADSALQQLELLRQLPPEIPAEARPGFEQAISALQGGSGRLEAARAAFDGYRRAVELTPAYQASLQGLEGPGATLAGILRLSFSPREAMIQRLARDAGTIRNAIRFSDATGAAGLAPAAAAAAADSSRGTAGSAAIAVGDYSGDRSEDFFLGGPPSSLWRSAPGGFRAEALPGKAVQGARAASFADYDNDGLLDLFVADSAGSRLYRNAGHDRWRDVTAAAGLGGLVGVRKALFADFDHDGDLDLLLLTENGIRLYRNDLSGEFTDLTRESGLRAGGADAVFGDFDGDGLLDLVVTGPHSGTTLFRNLGPGRFRDVTAASGIAAQPGSPLLAAGDYNNDGLLDLLLTDPAGAPLLYRGTDAGRFVPEPRSFAGLPALRSAQLVSAVFLDYDNDGFVDLALAASRGDGTSGLLLLGNAGNGRFEDRSSILPRGLGDVVALAAWDYERDGDLDLLVSERGRGPRLLRNDGGNLNLYVAVTLSGLRTGSGKNNDFGVGARLTLRAGELYQTRTVTDRVTYFGIGRHLKADVLRVEWPNGVPQTIYLPGSDQDVLEEQVLKGSCPFLYAWDGRGFRFVTDLVWKSALGMPVGIMASGNTAYAPAQASREYLRISGDRLAPREGRYLLQLTEELWETAYLDQLELVAVDHPDSVGVFVNERFVPPTADSSLRLYRALHARPPVAAYDDAGNDLLPLLRERDDRYAATLTPGRYQGLTLPHELVLDPGPSLVRNQPLLLLLNGWIFPTDASINVALAQNPNPQAFPPLLEVRDRTGRWSPALGDLGFPSGKNKTVIAELGGTLPGGLVRIRTNLQIYWDQVQLATEAPNAPVTLTRLTPVAADLHPRGYSRSFRKGGRYGPQWFDYDSVTREPRWRAIAGAFTRFGDVLPLLAAADDEYIILAPGDETTVEFDAARLPALPSGWRRDFLIYSVGWVKDADLHTAMGNTVAPLPFHAMTRYPYDSTESYPRDAAHRRYLETFNTRVITGERAEGRTGGRQATSMRRK